MAGWFSRAVSPLLKLWLASQVEGVEDLQIEFIGKNDRIFQGTIGGAKVLAKQICYQGLQLCSIDLHSTEIQLNLPQLLKGESLKLLEPIEVKFQALANSDRLNQSLRSEIVTDALGDSLTFPLTDAEIRSVFVTLFTKLGEGLQIDRLELTDGNFLCEGKFIVNRT